MDYMRARFYSPWTARFLSVDPARESANLQRPQTWNRFSYAFNNPVTLVDPDGQVAVVAKALRLAIKGGDIAGDDGWDRRGREDPRVTRRICGRTRYCSRLAGF
ncbi:MAG: RHS repeat-associated core domain-containing protein [Acidobacteriota bacterium]